MSSVAALGRVIGTLYRRRRRPVDDAGGRDLWSLLRTLRAFRSLDKTDAYRLLRWGPMAVADLVGESFEHERLRAAVAADGIFGTRLRSVVRRQRHGVAAARGKRGVAPAARLVRARRARRASRGARHAPFVRPEAASEPMPRQRGSSWMTSARVASCWRTAPRSLARAVISAVDPKQTFLRLCDPIDLAPEFLWRMRNYRAQGTLAKINLALSEAARRSPR